MFIYKRITKQVFEFLFYAFWGQRAYFNKNMTGFSQKES